MIKKLWNKFVDWLFSWHKKKWVSAKNVIVIVTATETFIVTITMEMYALVKIVNAKELMTKKKIRQMTCLMKTK